MYTKKFNVYSANTLELKYIGKHENGWSIKGEIHEDYFYWVNEFEARKKNMWVKGDFEKIVTASSKKAYDEFIENFPPNEWDYMDI